MDIPASLKILGKVWNVRRKDHLASDADHYGEVRWVEQVIMLDSSISGELLEDTLLHEIIHVVDHNAALCLDEESVKRLSSALHQVLHDNRLAFFDKESVKGGVAPKEASNYQPFFLPIELLPEVRKLCEGPLNSLKTPEN